MAYPITILYIQPLKLFCSMKKLLATTFASLFLALFIQLNVFSQVNPQASTTSGARITFAEKSHDFGDIQQGDKVNYTFKFTNTGTAPLIVSKVETTCGCTATNWTKDPVKPGDSGEIAATFNSTGRKGAQRKVITIYSNATNAKETVAIVSNVLTSSSE
jgi:hypothetical protein